MMSRSVAPAPGRLARAVLLSSWGLLLVSLGCVDEETAFQSSREAGTAADESAEAEPETCRCSEEEVCLQGACQPRRDLFVEYSIADGELTVLACGPPTAAYRNRQRGLSAWTDMRTGCRMWAEGRGALPLPGDFIPLDAGEISIRAEGGEALVLSREEDGCYRATGGAEFPVMPGSYTLAATGGGDVAAFEETLESPPPVVLDLAESYRSRSDMYVRWNGESRASVAVAVSVIGADTLRNVLACDLHRDRGHAAIPSRLLQRLRDRGHGEIEITVERIAQRETVIAPDRSVKLRLLSRATGHARLP